jgi:hypothetical protein
MASLTMSPDRFVLHANAVSRFLLKYVSRDAVEVLARGSGGASEARSAIAQFQETAPLYGFMLYRRRKVLITYIPDAASRLIKGTSSP